MKKLLRSILFAATTLCAAIMFFSSTAQAETTQCTPIITIPTTITTQGIYCLNGNLAGNLASGNAITVNTNNVTIDLNGYKLGNLAAGPSTGAYGIYSTQRKNITIRNGTIRGFRNGIFFQNSSTSSGHLIEDTRLDGNTVAGIEVHGVGSIIRNNQVVNTGGSTFTGLSYGILAIGSGARVLNNDVINVMATTSLGYGIYLSQGDGTVIAGNRISDVTSTSASSIGTYLLNSTGVTVSDNRIAGVTDLGVVYSAASTGSSGIYMNNTVSGSTTPFSGGSAAGTTNFSN